MRWGYRTAFPPGAIQGMSDMANHLGVSDIRDQMLFIPKLHRGPLLVTCLHHRLFHYGCVPDDHELVAKEVRAEDLALAGPARVQPQAAEHELHGCMDGTCSRGIVPCVPLGV